MRSTARGRLTLAVVLALPFLILLVWTEGELRPRLEGEVRGGLERQAGILAEAIGDQSFTDGLAERLGEAAGIRVTLIGHDGTVLGDSDVPTSRLPVVENHADRPEVAAALAGRVGTAIRPSETVSLRLIYVAVPHREGVVRVSRPLDGVDRIATRSRQWVLASGLLCLFLLFAVGHWVDRWRLRPVRRVQDALAALGAGEFTRRIEVEGSGSLALVGRSVNEMAARLEDAFESMGRERTDLKALFDQLEDGLAVLARDGTILRSNTAFERWLGRGGLEGEKIGPLLRDPANREAIESAIRGQPAHSESSLGRSILLLTAQPHGGGALVILRDLTRTRRLESVRRDFVAAVSHELKTPITNIRGFGEALSEGDVPADRAREFAGRIVLNARRMQQLVEDLLDLARIESGVWRPEVVPVDLTSVVEEAWADLQPQTEPEGVSLRCLVPEGLMLCCDVDAIRQVMRNLLENALRYAPEGSSVVVRADHRAGRDRVEVTDRGPGIPEPHRQRVFERFYRVDAARSREAGGTGLGLSIVKHLVAAHGGEVGVESEVGRGTTIWFTLPSGS